MDFLKEMSSFQGFLPRLLLEGTFFKMHKMVRLFVEAFQEVIIQATVVHSAQ